MYLVDYHVHTKRCGHACGEDREYIEAAIKKGLNEMGFADHVPRFYDPAPGVLVTERGMAWDHLEEYVRAVTTYQEEYREIAIRLGLEVDFVPGLEEAVAEIGQMYPWDYLIGSVHFIPKWNYGYILRDKEHEPSEIFHEYFQLVAEAAESGLYDFLGHIDLPKRVFTQLSNEKMYAMYQPLAARIGRAGAAIEVNTSGMRGSRTEADGIYPDIRLLSLCREHGVQVTLGSDAHRPSDVAMDFDRALELLQNAGYDELTTFRQRKAIPKKLNN